MKQITLTAAENPCVWKGFKEKALNANAVKFICYRIRDNLKILFMRRPRSEFAYIADIRCWISARKVDA